MYILKRHQRVEVVLVPSAGSNNSTARPDVADMLVLEALT